MASEESSTSTALSPVPGSAWENSVTVIKLIKGREGLGFSILNFAVSLNEERERERKRRRCINTCSFNY